MEFSYFMPVRLLFGANVIDQLGATAKSYGTHALIVTGRSSTKRSGLLDRSIALLEAAGVRAMVFNKVEPNPLTTTVMEGAALARALVEYLGRLNCVALLTTHYDGVSDAARRHYRVAGLGALDTAAIRKDEAPLDRLSRLMDYHLIESEPGEPCPRDALRVCRLLDLEPDLMEIFSKNS